MSRDRFFAILQMLHCTDNGKLPQAGDPDHDRRGKILELMDLIVRRWQSGYYPNREISVDETIIPFKGRTGMKVYKPNKPHKWGINCWNVAESCTGYVWNAELYQGKRNNETEVGMYKTLVSRMCQPLFDRGHHLYMDNLFSSPELYTTLAANQLGACGTLRVNRVGTPDEIKATKMKKGDDMRSVRDGHMMFISWFDKRQVNVVSTVHNASTFVKAVRARGQNDRREVDKPVLYAVHGRCGSRRPRDVVHAKYPQDYQMVEKSVHLPTRSKLCEQLDCLEGPAPWSTSEARQISLRNRGWPTGWLQEGRCTPWTEVNGPA